jgi:hypothetical protein
MAGSANELHDIVNTFLNDLRAMHIPGVNELLQRLTTSMTHVHQECSPWITNEANKIQEELQSHTAAFKEVVTRLEGTAAFLPSVLTTIEELMRMSGGG